MKNVDETCEFRQGDVIIQIDGDTKFRVVDSHGITMWYYLECLDDSSITVAEKRFVDSDFVKVDHKEER